MFQQITSLFRNQQGGGIHSRLLKNNYQKISKAIAFLFCVIFFVFLPVGFSGLSKAEAATYYVSKSTANGYSLGNNSNNGTSIATPKLTIASALSATVNGDTVMINDGTYTEGILYITKGITINPLNDLAVTIATTGSYIIDATIPAGTTFTLGAVIIEGGGTASYGIVYQDSPAIYSAILNNTKIQNCLRAVHGSHSTRINFTANNPVVTQLSNDGLSSIIFNNLVQGGININGGTFNLTSSNTTSSTAVFIKAMSLGVTASIMNMAINSTAGTVGGFAVLGTTNIANVVISGNTINISDIPGIHGAIDAIRVDSDYSNTLDASGAVIANNIITNIATGTGGAHLIIVGEDSSVLSSALRNKVNNARVYGNTLTGGDANNVIMHGIEIGNQTGGEVYNNKVDNVYIGVIAKGQTNGLYYKNIITRATSNYLRAKASTGTLFFNNTVIITPGFAFFGILANEDSATSIVSTGIDFRNNLIYSTTVPTRFAQVNAGSTAVFHNNSYYASVSSVSFQYQSTIYNDVNSWQQAQESSLVFADPVFVNFASGNYALQGTSPAIDSGISISGLTTDYLGNHIYGTPDIGAYEYQSPFTIITDNPNISSPIRIYADGKYRYTNTTSGSNNAKLSITPQAGFGTGDYSQWMDVSIDTWHTSSDYYKKWTESSTNQSLVTNHTIGDLKPNTYYTLKLDGTNQSTYLSNSTGQITFTYSGGYSTHTFEITEDTISPASFTLVSPANNTITSNRTPTFSWNPSSDTESGLSKYQLYLDGIIDIDNISNNTTSILPTNILSCGNHSWYIKAIDNNNNTTDSNIFTLNINCSGGFIPPTKPIVTPTDPTLGTVPSNISQIAISKTPDFTNISWQPFDKDKFKNIDQTTETLYVKFRTDQGAVSDTIIYSPQTSNQSTIVTLSEGDIVKTLNNPDVYVIKYKNNKQYKRLILSPLVFKSYQHLKWENIKTVSQEQLDQFTTSNLVKETIDTIIYQLFPNGDTGERKAQDTSINYDSDSIYEINVTDRDSYRLVE